MRNFCNVVYEALIPVLQVQFFFKKKQWDISIFYAWVNQLYMLLTLALFSLATDYTATSYIYQSLGDVEWFIEMKLSSWQQ